MYLEIPGKGDVGRREIKISENIFACRPILLAQDANRATRWRDEVKEHLNRRGLPRAIWAEKSRDGTFFHAKREVINRPHGAKFVYEMCNLNYRCHLRILARFSPSLKRVTSFELERTLPPFPTLNTVVIPSLSHNITSALREELFLPASSRSRSPPFAKI